MSNIYLTILIIYLAVTFAVGLWASKKSTTMSGFAIGGRSLGPVVVAATWGATMVSSSTYLGCVGYGWSNGWAGVMWGMVIMAFGGMLAWVLLAKKLRLISERTGTETIPGFLYARYGSKTLNTAISVMIFIFYIPIIASQFAGAGVLFETVFDINYTVGILVFGILVVVYTATGGFNAVAYTDAVQAFFMIACFFVVTPTVLSKVGGLTALNMTIEEIDPGLVSPHGVNNAFPLSLILSWLAYYVFGNIGQPYTLLRYFSAKNMKVLKWGFPIAMCFIVFIYFNIGVLGIASKVLLPDLDKADNAMPELIKATMHPILGGAMLSAVFAAMMSTVDSALHIIGTAISKDVYQVNFKPDADGKTLLKISRIATLAVGVISFVIALDPPDSILVLLTYGWTCMAAALFMPVLCGVYWKRFNKQAAIVSAICGCGAGAVWIAVFGGVASGIHPMGVALPAAVIAGIAVTLFTPAPDAKLIEPFFDPEYKQPTV